MNLLKRIIGRPGPSLAPATASAGADEPSPAERFVHEAFWIVLGRQVSPAELREQVRALESGDEQAFLLHLISSTEFRNGYARWKDGRSRQRKGVEEAALATLGSDDWFVERAYELLLGRPADDDGLRHHVGLLAGDQKRWQVLRGLALSEEFSARYADVAPQSGLLPRDTQLCELANPAKWDNPEWMKLFQDLKVSPRDKSSMHRKAYEFTQLLYGMERLGRLHEGTKVLSVGAGHEAILYWLANHVGSVVATDLYEVGRWESSGSREGDERVVKRPQDYAPFPYREDRLLFLKMDGRHLAFRSDAFDVAYSLSSIEHFGGVAGAQHALGEMARVLKPGGLLVLATEYQLSGAAHKEVFTPAEIHALASQPGMRLVQPIDENVYRRYECVPVDLYKNRFQTPHMVVRMGDTVFTTVMVFLEKE